MTKQSHNSLSWIDLRLPCRSIATPRNDGNYPLLSKEGIKGWLFYIYGQDFLNRAIHGASSFYRIFDAISSPLSSNYSGRESRSDKILIEEGL